MIDCRNSYKPSRYVTNDEKLVGFKERYSYRIYTPSKSTRYEIKIVMMCND